MEENPRTFIADGRPADAPYIAPQTAIEDAVARIWGELLDVDRVGSGDNFILMGGESLLASQAASRIRDIFGCEVGIRTIFLGTVAEVAAEIALKGGALCSP